MSDAQLTLSHARATADTELYTNPTNTEIVSVEGIFKKATKTEKEYKKANVCSIRRLRDSSTPLQNLIQSHKFKNSFQSELFDFSRISLLTLKFRECFFNILSSLPTAYPPRDILQDPEICGCGGVDRYCSRKARKRFETFCSSLESLFCTCRLVCWLLKADRTCFIRATSQVGTNLAQR